MNLLEYLKEKKNPSSDSDLNFHIADLCSKDALEERPDDKEREDVKRLKEAEGRKDLLRIPFYVYKKISRGRKELVDEILHPISSNNQYVIYSNFIEHEEEIMKDILVRSEDFVIYFDNYLYHLYNQVDKLSIDRSLVSNDIEFKKLRMREHHEIVRRYSIKGGTFHVVKKAQESTNSTQ